MMEDSHAPVIKVSVIATEGSAPRRKYSTMFVSNTDTQEFMTRGSVGGGALEHSAIKEAQGMLVLPRQMWRRRRRKISLGSDLKQSCGGQVELLFELLGDYERRHYEQLRAAHKNGFIAIPHASGRPIFHSDKVMNETDIYSEPITQTKDMLYLFGAGHVGRAVAYHVSVLDFSLHWIDFARPRFPDNAESLCRAMRIAEHPPDIVAECESHAYYLVMTHSHALDYAIVSAILGRRDCTFLGLIGSRAKAARFRSQLKRDGHNAETIARLTSPIGLVHTRDNTPHAIAVSTVAQLLQVKDTRNRS